MSIENPNIQTPPQPRETIDDLLWTARQEGHGITEIKVWQTDTALVPDGELGVMATDELNGCHVSIFVTPAKGGDTMTMTHFPPEIGKERYRQALETLNASVQEQGVTPKVLVTLTASDRPTVEDTWASSNFPEVPHYSLTYTARDRERRASPDAGRCMAVLDKREGAATLHVLTDSGDQAVVL